MTGAQAFSEAIRATLGSCPEASKIVPGRFIRFSVSDQGRDDAGYCKMFDDGDGGVFGCWRSGVAETWQAKQATTPEDRAAFAERVKQARAEAERIREQEREECRIKSAELWDKGRDVAADHPYILAKCIRPIGIKQLREMLMIPVRDTAGTLHGLQCIQPDGAKRFKTGTAVAGCFLLIGKPESKLCICEGYATGATIHQATGCAVAVAFNAGNLKPVALALRKKHPDIDLIVCADDDHATEGNPGMTKATEAARAVNGLLAVPVFPQERGPKDTDFNDLARIIDLDAVFQVITTAADTQHL